MAEAASNTAAKTSTIADPKTSVGSTTNSTTAQGSAEAASVSNLDNSSNSAVSNATPAVSGAAATVDPAESRVPLRTFFALLEPFELIDSDFQIFVTKVPNLRGLLG